MIKLAIPLLLAAGAHATDVYRNITTPVGTYNTLVGPNQTDSLERGNQVNLGGTERTAQQFAWRLRPIQNGVAQFDARLRFYANDGPGGEPGTILWDSGLQHMLTDSGPDMTINTWLPPISLPNTVTWSIQVFNRSGMPPGSMGPAHYHPPTIGSAPFGYWERSAQGAWSFTGQNEPPFGARIQATSCYANCDNSTTPPVLNVLDFTCFLNHFALGTALANCDNSSTPPVLNVLDFSCFLNKFSTGCP